MSKEKKQALNVRIPKDLHQEARIEAIREGKSLTQVIIDLLSGWLNKAPEQQK